MSIRDLGPKPHTAYWQIADETAGCIELPQLDREGVSYSDRLVSMIFDARAQPLEISLGPYLDHQLRTFHFASVNARQKRCSHLFGVGFPVFMFQTEQGWSSFPLFVIRLRLQSRQDGLFITRDRNHGMEPNSYLLEEIRKRSGKDIGKICQTLLAKPFVHEKDLNKALQQIASQTGIALWDKEHAWAPLPGSADRVPYQETGVIVKTAYLGLFEPLLAVRENKSAKVVTRQDEGSGTSHPFGLLSLDPFQEQVFRQIQSGQRFTAVEGPKGSGKTHLLVQLLSNALANGKNCLVLSNYLAPLKEVSAKLAHFDLRAVSFLYQQTTQDDALLLELLRSVLEQTPKSSPQTDPDRFDLHLEKIRRARRKLDDQYQLVRTPLIDDWNWTELVGRFFSYNRREGREKLAMQLNPQRFDFTGEEYGVLIKDVQAGAGLIERVKKPDSALKELHPRLFLTGGKEDNAREVERRLSFNLAKGKKLLDQYAAEQGRYAEALYLYYDGALSELDNLLRKFRESYQEATERFGDKLFRKGGMSGFFSAFSAKTKRLKEERNKIIRAYNQLRKGANARQLFDFEFPVANDADSLPELKTRTDKFGHALDEWRLDINKIIREDLGRLSRKTVLSELGFGQRLEELEYDLELFIQHLNEEQLLTEELSHRMLILPQQQQYLDSVVGQLERLHRAAPEFENFFDWQRYWINLSDKSQTVIKSLAKSRTNNWVEAFESWYANQCLIKFNQPGLPQHNLDLPEYSAQSHKFKDILRQRIIGLLREARWQCADRLRKKNRPLYNALVQRKGDRSVDSVKLLQDHFPEVVACIPVLFSTPANISTIINRNGFEFDYVFVEDSQTLWRQDIDAIAQWGKQVVLFSESGPEGAPLTTGLADGWSGLDELPDLQRFRLENIHRWQPGNLPSLRQGRLLFPRKAEHYDVDYIKVEARYDEQQQTNEEEAQLVLRLLNDVRETPQRTYPKVGIVCFTTGQRNLVLGYLHRIKQQDLPGADKIKQLERNGLGISAPEDLISVSYDILIVSVTYGEIDLKGTITNDLNELDQPIYHHYLHRLLAAGGSRLQIISSLPSDMLETFVAEQSVPGGRTLLSFYLLYLKALADQDLAQTDRLVQKFGAGPDVPGDNAGQGGSSVRFFEEEVVRALQPHLPTPALGPDPEREYGLHLRYLLPKSRDGKSFYYLLTEGFLSSSQTIDYDWDYRRIKHLERLGFEALPVWSTNWWKNSDAELKRLARLIQQKVLSSEE